MKDTRKYLNSDILFPPSLWIPTTENIAFHSCLVNFGEPYLYFETVTVMWFTMFN